MLRTTTNLRVQVISTLSTLRQEWQEASEGQSLLDVEGNIGLVFADLVNSFGLSTHEQIAVLGTELFEEMQKFIAMPSQN